MVNLTRIERTAERRVGPWEPVGTGRKMGLKAPALVTDQIYHDKGPNAKHGKPRNGEGGPQRQLHPSGSLEQLEELVDAPWMER
jgi:hypothetical protein